MMDDQVHPEILALGRQAQELLFAGRLDDALDLFEQLISRLEKESPEDVELRADVTRLYGSVLYEMDDLKGSNAALSEAIALLQDVHRTPHQDLILALATRQLARNYDEGGQASRAEALREQVYQVLDRLIVSLPDRAAEVAIAMSSDLEEEQADSWQEPVDWLTGKGIDLGGEAGLSVLANLYEFWQARGEEAKTGQALDAALRQVAALDREQLIKASQTVLDLGTAALRSEHFDSARQVIRLLKGAAGSLDVEGVFLLRRLEANLTFHEVGAKEALDSLQEVFDFGLENFGAGHRYTRTAQWELGDMLAAAGYREDAVEVYKDLLDEELELDEDPLSAARLATTLGRELDSMFEFVESHDYHRLALSLFSEALGDYHPETNGSRYEVAELSRVAGYVEEAEFCFLQAMEVAEDLGETESEQFAKMMNNLGELYVKTGRFAAARPLIEKALALRQRLFGSDSAQAWRSREALANLDIEAGNTPAAVEAGRAAFEHPAQSKNPNWFIILARALLEVGEIEESAGLFQRLYNGIPEEDFGNPNFWEAHLSILKGLTICRVMQEEWGGAHRLASNVLEWVRTSITEVMQTSAEGQVTRFVREVNEIQSLWIWSLLRDGQDDPESLAGAFELVQLTKGLRTRYLRWRQPGVAGLDLVGPPGYEDHFRQLQQERRQLVQELTAEFMEAEDPEEYSKSQEVLAKHVRLREIDNLMARGIQDWEVIPGLVPVLTSRILPDGAAAMEIVVLRDIVNERYRAAPAASRYVAFILGPNPDSPLRLIDFGLLDDLDEAIHSMKDSLMGEPWLDGYPQPEWSRLSRFIGKKILSQLSDELESASHLLIAPDGLLGAVPFEILATPQGEMLLDVVNVSYLIRLGELLDYRSPFPVEENPLVLAGPDFDLEKAIAHPRSSQKNAEQYFSMSIGGDNRFEALPEAKVEGQLVAECLEVEPLLGEWALAPELLRSRSPEIIHLSTHGFCLPFQMAADQRRVLAAPLGNVLDTRMVLEDPMQRSGLALSGANAVLEGRPLPEEVGAGILYAADIQQLDLQRTDLVVLSACRSGLGDLEIGDGAHGLRRAFLAAGCKSVVSALWDVPEKSARQLLVSFYEGLLEGKSRVEALNQARTAVRELYPRDPIHWAGFVLDGFFEPLNRFSGLSDLRVASVSLKSWGVASESDPENSERLVQRLMSGPTPDPEEFASPRIVVLRQARSKPDLDTDLRVTTLSALASIANRLGDYERSVAYIREILGLEDLSPEQRLQSNYDLALNLQLSGQEAEAITRYTTVLEGDVPAWLRAMTLVNRGNLYLIAGRPSDALADLTAVIDDPETPQDQRFMAHSNRAEIRFDEQPEDALEDVEAALSLEVADDYESLPLRYYRASLLLRLGQRGAALSEIAALEDWPDLSDEFRGWLSELKAEALDETDR